MLALDAFQVRQSKPGEPTRIVLADRRTMEQPQVGEKKEKDNSFKGYSKLRVRIEIHPVSNSKYFHIVVHLYFEATGHRNDEQNETTDAVELLFLAESRGSSNRNDQSPQGNNAYDDATQLPSNLSPSGLVEISIGGELLVVHVLSEQKSSGQKRSVGQNQRLGLCHCVTVRVTKGEGEDVHSQGEVLKETADKKKNGNSRWHSLLSPFQTVVTEGDNSLGEKRRRGRKSSDEESDDWMDPMIWFPIRPTTAPVPHAQGTPTTTVCLQSWSVKSISSHEVSMPPATQNVLHGIEGTIVAQGLENDCVTRGMEFRLL
jgi:hypothetical protein